MCFLCEYIVKCNLFLWSKLNFSIITPVFSVTWSVFQAYFDRDGQSVFALMLTVFVRIRQLKHTFVDTLTVCVRFTLMPFNVWLTAGPPAFPDPLRVLIPPLDAESVDA